MAVALKIHLESASQKELKHASQLLDISLTLKYTFKSISRRNYKQRNGLYGQTRYYELNRE